MMCDLISWLLKQADNTWTLRNIERWRGRHRARQRERERDIQGVWKSIVSAFYHS